MDAREEALRALARLRGSTSLTSAAHQTVTGRSMRGMLDTIAADLPPSRTAWVTY